MIRKNACVEHNGADSGAVVASHRMEGHEYTGVSGTCILPYKQEVRGSSPRLPTTTPFSFNAASSSGATKNPLPDENRSRCGAIVALRDAHRTGRPPAPRPPAQFLADDRGAYVRFPLTRKQWALVDAADWPVVSRSLWYAHFTRSGWYAASRVAGRIVLLHRFLLDAPPGVRVDHKDGDGLNCRRHNIRLASAAENNYNSRRRRRSGAPFKGIREARGRWKASIRQGGKARHLGTFSTPEAAARAYDAALVEVAGEFARTNFPQEAA